MSKGKIVASAPYFQVCKKCGRHGRFVIPSRNIYSQEIMTKQDGLESAEHALNSGLVERDELPELNRQINISPIPDSHPDINIIFCDNFISVRYEEIKKEVEENTAQKTDGIPVGVTWH